MLTVDPKTLIRVLTPTCSIGVEQGLAACVRLTHHEITVAHLLLGLLEDPSSDVSVLLDRAGVKAAAAREVILRRLGRLRGMNTGRPVFSPHLFSLIEETWRGISTDHGESRVRSGALLARLASAPVRYDEETLAAELASMLPDLRRYVPGNLARSREDAEAKLEVPPAARRKLPRELITHHVAAGETLLDVARRYAIDVEDAARENNLGIHDPLTPGTALNLRVLPRDVVSRSGA